MLITLLMYILKKVLSLSWSNVFFSILPLSFLLFSSLLFSSFLFYSLLFSSLTFLFDEGFLESCSMFHIIPFINVFVHIFSNLYHRNVLLLDEPTNHLDLDSVYWLEGFLQKQTIPMVIVSHDREFLDRVCNKIVDVEEGTTVSYQGNYSKHLEQKRNRLEVWRDKYDKQVRFVKEEEKWIKKARNDPNMAQQVKAKESSLEKVKNSPDWVEQPPKDKKFRFRFPPAPRCGASVVESNKLTHGYGNGQHKTLFEDVDINVERGDRVGFVGPNGSGKSTMMRLIMGIETPKSGYTEFGGTNVQANYYQQNQADAMDLERTVLETVMDGAPTEYTFTGNKYHTKEF